ncbi:MAG TPA: cation:proton antiporter, partial [Propionibacteriaceae bacterium]
MSLPLLALVGLAALAGPLLAGVARWRMPVVIGQLLAGILIGGSGLRLVDASEPTFSFLGQVGFAVTMFVAGTHVPVRDARLRPALLTGVLRAVAVGVLSAAAGFGVAAVFHTGHGALYAVLMASSSAALVLPAVDQLGLGGSQLLPTLAQVAVADTACIVALPLVIDPANAPRAALGALL